MTREKGKGKRDSYLETELRVFDVGRGYAFGFGCSEIRKCQVCVGCPNTGKVRGILKFHFPAQTNRLQVKSIGFNKNGSS